MKYEYTQGSNPLENGVYACRTQDIIPSLLTDMFMIWSNSKWISPGSGLEYTRKVRGWIGPLQRIL